VLNKWSFRAGMSKQDTEIQDMKSTTEVEDPKRRQLLKKASGLAVYTAPALFALSQSASASSKPNRSAPNQAAPGRTAPGRAPANQTMSVGDPPPPPIDP